MIETSTTAKRRLVVKREPMLDEPPWRAQIVHEPGTGDGPGAYTPVGRFDSHDEAVRTGCTALRFLAAGIPWRMQP